MFYFIGDFKKNQTKNKQTNPNKNQNKQKNHKKTPKSQTKNPQKQTNRKNPNQKSKPNSSQQEIPTHIAGDKLKKYFVLLDWKTVISMVVLSFSEN